MCARLLDEFDTNIPSDCYQNKFTTFNTIGDHLRDRKSKSKVHYENNQVPIACMSRKDWMQRSEKRRVTVNSANMRDPLIFFFLYSFQDFYVNASLLSWCNIIAIITYLCKQIDNFSCCKRVVFKSVERLKQLRWWNHTHAWTKWF